MTILFAFGFCTVFILALVGCLNLQTWNSRVHMINADWLDAPEKFKLITRWGTQF